MYIQEACSESALEVVENEQEIVGVEDETKLSSDSSSHYSLSDDSGAEYNGPESLPSESGSESSFPHTISQHLKWHPATDLSLSNDCLVVQSLATNSGEAHTLQPLQRTGEFEIIVEARGPNTQVGFVGIGIGRRHRKSPHPLNTITGCCIWQTSAILNALKKSLSTAGYEQARDLELLIKGDRVGLKITEEGDLEFFINGQSQGVAATDVYKPSNRCELYPLVRLPAGYAVRITAGGKNIMNIDLPIILL